MTSAIDPTKPTTHIAYTADVRNNFQRGEPLTAELHAHQRNERQYVPLSYLGSWITMVNGLRQEVEKAIARIDDSNARLRVELDDLNARLARVEQQPNATDKELLAAVAGDHEGLAVDVGGALAQIVKTRHGDA